MTEVMARPSFQELIESVEALPIEDREMLVGIIGMADCGGCPGRNAVRVAQDMVKRGAEVVYLATCVVKPMPTPPACDHPDEIAQAIRDKTGGKVVMGTY
jgi:predicted metal-binding protein